MTFGRRMDLAAAGRAVAAFSDWGGGGGEFDTAFMYGGGDTERILGEILAQRGWEGITLATKAHPGAAQGTPSLRPEEVERQLAGSLQRLQCDAIDLFYLHSPDNDTPLERTLEACARLHADGSFRRLGLSNYAAWQVADAHHLCSRHGWPLPEVYQGMYNAVTRDVEPELLPCLRHLGMSFYAYNPLAGGLLTGRYLGATDVPASGRFSEQANYVPRYWKRSYLAGMKGVQAACEAAGISMPAAALAWMRHHGSLDAAAGDAVILGASTLEQLAVNLDACRTGPLDDALAAAFDAAWETCRPDCPPYFRT
jgi:aflatoxin B1 aldehyde reductase